MRMLTLPAMSVNEIFHLSLTVLRRGKADEGRITFQLKLVLGLV
jgi:hypothetical protein